MNPVDMLNPSDDYIWQILFAGENDAVPKRVTGAELARSCTATCTAWSGRVGTARRPADDTGEQQAAAALVCQQQGDALQQSGENGCFACRAPPSLLAPTQPPPFPRRWPAPRPAAHLHHPPATALSYLDDADTDPLLDAILADDLPPAPPGFDHQQHHDFLGPLPGEDHHGQGHAHHRGAGPGAPGGSGSGGSGGTVPGGDTGHGASGGAGLHGMDGLLGQQQVVPQQPYSAGQQPYAMAQHGQHHAQNGQHHAQHMQHAGQPPFRNGYSGHGSGELPPVKLEGAAATAAAGGFI